jgi:acyl dehydratase
MRYFEDFKVGESIELGSWTVTEDEIIEFAKEFDPQPFHIDKEKAKQSIYGGLIASGWHTGSMFMRRFAENLLNETASMGSPGLEELRWLKPVRPDDILRGLFTVLEARTSNSRPGVGIIRAKSEVVNQNGEVVMHLVGTNFIGRRPTGE